jgi:membrane protein implicated in regulation of membrane protease activity
VRAILAIVNDIASIIAGIILAALAILFLIFPAWIIELAQNIGLKTSDTGTVIVYWLLAFALVLPILYLLVFIPLLRLRPRRGDGLAVRKGQGVGYIDPESVRQQVYISVTRIGGIQRAEVSIDNENGRADVRVNLQTESNINAPKKKQEVRREIKKVVEDQFGVALASEPTINMRLESAGLTIPHAAEETKTESRPMYTVTSTAVASTPVASTPVTSTPVASAPVSAPVSAAPSTSAASVSTPAPTGSPVVSSRPLVTPPTEPITSDNSADET